MKRCTRLGVNVTKRCNFRCKSCFYLHEADFFTNFDVPLANIVSEIDRAKAKGLDHVVIVGYGEPTLWPELMNFVKYNKSIGMKCSIITNGTARPSFYESLYAEGLDHVHVSVHGVGEALNVIASSNSAGAKQHETLDWLKSSSLPWRSNTTLQLENYKELLKTTEFILEHGCSHVVHLGFLPHYGWNGRVKEVAVHPGILRPILETAMDKVIKAGKWLTLRYHPMCHLRPDLWKYVTNANMVVYDSGEWQYDESGSASDEKLKEIAFNIGNSVSIKTAPCTECDLYSHCGGWNHVYAEGYDGADLRSIKGLPPETKEFQFFWNANPFNNEFKGHFK